MHTQQEKIHSKVESSCVLLQNPTLKTIGMACFQDHSEMKKHLISKG